MSTDATASERLDDEADYAFLAREFDRVRDRLTDEFRDIADQIGRVTKPGPHQENPGFSHKATEILALAMSSEVRSRLIQLQRTADDVDKTLLARRWERASESEGSSHDR